MFRNKSLKNNYNLLRMLGKGGQGSVWLGVDKKTNKNVALKLIDIQKFKNAHVVQEVKALIDISNPQCMAHLSCYIDSFADIEMNKYVIAMEYIEGKTISEHTNILRNNISIQGYKNLFILTLKYLLKALLPAIMFLHEKRLLHNDIKPGNIMVDKYNTPILVDYGLSCFTLDKMNQGCVKPYNKVVSSCCLKGGGTVLYLPPERFRNVRYEQSDYWSLAATIYKLYTGKNVWGIDVKNLAKKDLYYKMYEKISKNIPLERLNTGDKTLDYVVNNFLSINPYDRMSAEQAIEIIRKDLESR